MQAVYRYAILEVVGGLEGFPVEALALIIAVMLAVMLPRMVSLELNY